MKKYDISIVMGSKNRKNLIKSTIKSIRNNGFKGKTEIIVVDGGSIDGTCDWLAKQNDVFTIIQPNYTIENDKGFKVKAHSWGEFMNIGFKTAHSDYICMVSDDLILAPGCLQKGYDKMRDLISRGQKIGGGAFYFREYPRHDYYRVIKLPHNYYNINHGFYYRPALENVGWLDEENYYFYNGDGDVAMRLNDSGWKTITLEGCFALHLVHLPVLFKSKLPKWYFADDEMFQKKYAHLEYNEKMEVSKERPNIDATAFWRHSLKNVITGYLLRLYDKKRK